MTQEEDLKIIKENTKILKIVHKRGLIPAELERVLKSVENAAPRQIQAFSDYFERKVKIGVFSDCHIGAREFDEPFFRQMVKIFKKEDVSRIYDVGDHLEGMSNRPGHVYQLSQIGFSQQMKKAEEMYSLLHTNIFGIDGNHDQWYQKKSDQGIIVGEELEKRVKNYHHLGQDEANLKVGRNVTIKLVHPGDGTAYAISYKMQKRMEAFTGGEKPNAMFSGHYHKALYMYNRNIHGIECGTLCGQTQWMRSKNIPAHKGFWIVEMELGRGGIGSFKPTFYAGYK